VRRPVNKRTASAMKKILYTFLCLGLLLSMALIASNFFRYELYELAIEFESKKADLKPKHQAINNLDYFFLARENFQANDTVVLLHGFSANKENWLRFSQELPSETSIYALDLLGHGQHPINLSHNYSIETQVDYLHHFITNLKSKSIHLVGNSMGGAVAALYSAKYPTHVQSLMLISPAGVHKIPSQLDESLNAGVNPLIANSVEEFFQVVNFVMEDKPFIPTPILTVQAEKSIKRANLNRQIFKDLRNDMTKNLDKNFSRIQAPTLILWGKEDRVIHPDNIHQYASLIKNSTPVVLNRIGHLAMIESPKLAAENFITLLSSNKSDNLP